MSDTPPPYIPDKDEIRRKLPIDFICAKHGILLNRDGKAICPFHDDSDPSFHLYDGDDGITRWHCYPCSIGGDNLDLILKLNGGTFPEALVYASQLLAELPPDYEPPKRAIAPRFTPENWYTEVNDARGRATEPQHDGILALRGKLVGLDTPLHEAHEWDFFLRNTLGWGLGHDGALYIPHWSPEGVLTGCKIRKTDSKSSLPGSKYEHLYGSWLGRRHRSVLLTEGETDHAYASFKSAKERIPLDVFALPSGANQPVLPTYLDFLKGSSIIYLAFDPDESGVDATRVWLEALNNANFHDVRACCLPYKRDLRDARPTIRLLLAAAKKPLGTETINIEETPAGYVRRDNDGNPVSVTTWTIDPITQLAGDGEDGFEVMLRTRGIQERVVIRLADLASTFTLNKWANAHGEIFTATDGVRRDIAEYVKARGSITPEIFQTAQVGLQLPPSRYDFAGPSVVLTDPNDGYLGQLPWRYVPSTKAANVTGRLYLPYDHGAHEEETMWRWSFVQDFLSLSSPDVTQPLLAWLVAAARRHECREFPIMFIGGSSGVGKSTLARFAIRLLGSNVEIDMGAVTPFILSRTLAATTTLPVFVDEWTRLSRQDTREAFQGLVPLLYTGGIAERGQADLSVQVYQMTAPTLVAGEDTFALDRELERTVCIFPSRGAQNTAARAALANRHIEGFGHYLHTWLCDQPTLPQFPTSMDDRVAYNKAVLQIGWATLREFLDFMSTHGYTVPEVPVIPDLSCFDKRAVEGTDENVYVQALRSGLEMSDQSQTPVVWPAVDGTGTYVRAKVLIGLIRQRGIDVQLPGGYRAMLNYFAERYGDPVYHKRIRPPNVFSDVSAHFIPGLQLIDHTEEVTDAPPEFPQT